MKIYNDMEIWFVVGAQSLYGEETLAQVDADGRQIAEYLGQRTAQLSNIVYQTVLTTPSAITKFFNAAAAADSCAAVICWQHTFSPAKMWISGLKKFHKPVMHLHTQFEKEIPWADIDMAYMNTHQSAHGGREFGHVMTRLASNRKIVVGHWQSAAVMEQLQHWIRVVAGIREAANLTVARFGDNMRSVAVTEGDKVAAQIKTGISVDGYGIENLVASIASVGSGELTTLLEEYEQRYKIAASLRQDGAKRAALQESAKIELGLTKFLAAHGCTAFTTNFETLHGMKQLPGMAVQRLMAQGYGFAAEGDWKGAALLRIMKVMSQGISGGTSFMEDYVYHLADNGQRVLGSHMLEICPTIADPATINVEIHPLSIGGKEDPVRMVFNVPSGAGINVSWVDLGDRFRFIINEIEVEAVPEEMPKLPVARAYWNPQPNLRTAATAWILAGGSHHTCFSKAVDSQMMLDFAELLDIEALVIDGNTDIRSFKNELRWNQAWHVLCGQ